MGLKALGFVSFFVIFMLFKVCINLQLQINIFITFNMFVLLQHFDRMDSQEGEEPPPNGSQTDSRLKGKKPPSLVIAIPPPEDMTSNDHDKQVN